MTTGNQHAAATPEQIEATGAELQRSARQIERTAFTLGATVRAIVRDTGFALLGAGDVVARALRDAPRRLTRLPDWMLAAVSGTGRGIGAGFEHLCERGQMVAAQVRHDRGVRTAVVRAEKAGRSTRRAMRSMRRAARAQVRGARRSAAALGRPPRSRYRHMVVDELRELAARRQIEGRSRMDKAELIAALRR
jgi:hypothetical protein